MPDLAAEVRSVRRVLAEAPLFHDQQTNLLDWHARPYMNCSPPEWIARAVEILDRAAKELEQL